MRTTRTTAVTLAVGAALSVGAAPASASNMTPLVNCVETTATGSVAYFGYRNDEAATITRTVGIAERVFKNGRWVNHGWLNMVYDGAWTGSAAQVGVVGRGQPTSFTPGTQNMVFTVSFPTDGSVTWALVGRFATANAQSPKCDTPPPTPTTTVPPTTPVPPAAAPVTVAGNPPAPAATTPAASAPRECRSRRLLTIRLRERKGQKIKSARVVFNGKTISNARRTSDGRLVARIDFRQLPSGRFSVQIKANLVNGKTRTYTRKYYTCKPKWAPVNNLESKTAL